MAEPQAAAPDAGSKSPAGIGPKPAASSLFAPLSKTIDLPFIGPTPRYYFVLLFLFILYILSKSILVGLIAGALMVAIVIFEFYQGVKEGGVVNELKQTAIAIAIVIAVWFIAGFVLQTSNPINAIVSCSMRPAYERGDFVILAGGVPRTMDYSFNGPSSEINSTAYITGLGRNWTVSGSLLAYCANGNQKITPCADFIRSPAEFVEWHGPLELHYGVCQRVVDSGPGRTYSTICVRETKFSGQAVPFNSSDDLIVYSPAPGDLYARVGDIVHRARLRINASDGPVLLTKGDNNPVYDLQAFDFANNIGNSPIKTSQVKGHVILRIPYLGNLKLFISPQILADPSALSGCDSYFEESAR